MVIQFGRVTTTGGDTEIQVILPTSYQNNYHIAFSYLDCEASSWPTWNLLSFKRLTLTGFYKYTQYSWPVDWITIGY